MTPDDERARIGYAGRRLGWRVQGLVGKLVAFTAAAVLLVGAVAISVVVFAIVAAAVLVIGIYLWWKTRALRKQMREARARGTNIFDGEVRQRDVIEGEIVRDERPREDNRNK